MRIAEFLKKVSHDELELEDQKIYLKTKHDYDAQELLEAIEYLKAENGIDNLISTEAIDVCGTGGNTGERINTSTLIAFILAAMGARVVKHGNRAQSGRYGSFDLLGDLEIDFEARNEAREKKVFEDTNLLFLFAPHFFGSLKSLAPARKDLGCFTFMNVLGPLLNPYNPTIQMIGSSDASKLRVIVETAKLLGRKRVIAYSCNGSDDYRLDEKTIVCELNGYDIREYKFDPNEYGFHSGEYPQFYTDKINLYLNVLNGADNSIVTEHVILNAAVAYGIYSDMSFEECIDQVRKIVLSGSPLQKYNDYLRANRLDGILYDLSRKKSSIKRCSLANAVANSNKGIIAEIKYKSPSAPEGFANSNLLPEEISLQYCSSGDLVGISHVVDATFFGGSFENLSRIKNVAPNVPLLAKGFFTRNSEILMAKECGADAILLIRKILNKFELQELIDYAHKCGLEVLLETDAIDDINECEKFGPDLIGFNCRDLGEYKINFDKIQNIESEIPLVYESGIQDCKDVRNVPSGFKSMLIGTALMNADNISLKLKELSGEKILKICGVRSAEVAVKLESIGVDLMGLNFIDYSKRKIDLSHIQEIREAVKSKNLVGLFDVKAFTDFEKINRLCPLDFIQIIGNENDFDFKGISVPIIGTFNVNTEADIKAANESKCEYIILDGPESGSGKTIDTSLLATIKRPFILAGGINVDNLPKLQNISDYLLGFDVASGAETAGMTDTDLVEKLLNLTHNVGS